MAKKAVSTLHHEAK